MKQMTVDLWQSAIELPDAPVWLQSTRRRAFARFQELGWPKDERYKHTDLRPLEHGMPLGKPGQATLEQIQPFLPKTETARLVFVDGQHSPQLSETRQLPGGVLMRRMIDCLDDLQDHFEALVQDDALVSLNTATWQDGAFVHVPEDQQVPGVLHIMHVQTGKTALRSLQNVIRVADGAKATVMESHVHLDDHDGMSLATTHIVAGHGARINHVKVQKEDRRARHIAIQRVRQEKDSHFQSVLLDVGGVQARQEVHADLLEEGAHCDLQGVFFGQRQQRRDVWTRIDHRAPNCTSHERFKGIMDDESRGAFTGLIVVHPGARGTSSDQENRNLLLSDRSHVDATPQLEIHNDDVRCSHGSTIGQLNEDQLFFLRSRGIGVDAARMMLTRAFASEVIQAVEDQGIRELLDKYLHVWFIKHQEHLR